MSQQPSPQLQKLLTWVDKASFLRPMHDPPHRIPWLHQFSRLELRTALIHQTEKHIELFLERSRLEIIRWEQYVDERWRDIFERADYLIFKYESKQG